MSQYPDLSIALIGRSKFLANQKHYSDLGSYVSSFLCCSFLGGHCAGKALMALRNASCFLRLGGQLYPAFENVGQPIHRIQRILHGHAEIKISYLQVQGLSWGGGGGPGVPVDPPTGVGLILSKQPTIFRWRKRHANILAINAIVEKPTFLKFVFL